MKIFYKDLPEHSDDEVEGGGEASEEELPQTEPHNFLKMADSSHLEESSRQLPSEEEAEE